MKKDNLKITLWISGLVTGALLGAYYFRNQEKFSPQEKKIKGLIADLKKTAGEIGDKALKAGQEQLEATIESAMKKVESVKKSS